MRKLAVSIVMALAVAAFAVPAFATNGTDVIGVGPISRSMGGVGAAAPQDAISAVFANPAAMCYIPCETSEVDFAATVFDPTVKAKVTFPTEVGPQSVKATSQGAPYAFPAIGIYTPITPDLRFGLAAYGVAGLGVDYKDTDLKNVGQAFGISTPGTDVKTDLQIMKFAPNLAYRILPNLSVGAALQINWAALDLGDGSAHNFGIGTQLGVIYKPIDPFTVGVTYQTAQSHEFKRIANFNPPAFAGFGTPFDTERDTLKLEQPQQVVLGLAYDIIPSKLLIEADGKWLNWSNADGYKDFGWDDQWVAAVGVQARPIDWLAVRVGYNYANNPLKKHDNFDAFGVTRLQGTPVNTFFYEYLRTIGFPAIVEQHVTAGLGINITKKVSLNVGYTHAFEHTFSEKTKVAALGGQPLKLESSLAENSYEFGVNIMF